MSGQNWSLIGCDLNCRAFTSPSVGEAAFEANLENLQQHWNCVLLCNQFICPRRHLYLVCIAGVQWRSSFVFHSTGISSNSSIAFSWLTSTHDPDWGSFVQRMLCPVQVTSFQFSEPTEKSFLSLDKTRCSISVPPVPKRSSTNRLMVPATDFPVARLPAMLYNIFSNGTSASLRTRGLVKMLLVSCHSAELFCFQVRLRDRIQYNT